jgi:hypothetical protein
LKVRPRTDGVSHESMYEQHRRVHWLRVGQQSVGTFKLVDIYPVMIGATQRRCVFYQTKPIQVASPFSNLYSPPCARRNGCRENRWPKSIFQPAVANHYPTRFENAAIGHKISPNACKPGKSMPLTSIQWTSGRHRQADVNPKGVVKAVASAPSR